MKSNEKCVYVVLTQTGTNVSKLIQRFTKAPFNHSSIASDDELSEMFSFCRLYKHSPLPAGFFHEKVDGGVFEMFKNIPCQIYAIPATDEQYDKYREVINHFKNSSKMYTYNLIGLFAMAFGKTIKRKNAFVCSQFVAHVLSESGIVSFNKEPHLVTPEDLRHLPNASLIYSGDIKQYTYNKVLAGA